MIDFSLLKKNTKIVNKLKSKRLQNLLLKLNNSENKIIELEDELNNNQYFNEFIIMCLEELKILNN